MDGNVTGTGWMQEIAVLQRKLEACRQEREYLRTKLSKRTQNQINLDRNLRGKKLAIKKLTEKNEDLAKALASVNNTVTLLEVKLKSGSTDQENNRLNQKIETLSKENEDLRRNSEKLCKDLEFCRQASNENIQSLTSDLARANEERSRRGIENEKLTLTICELKKKQKKFTNSELNCSGNPHKCDVTWFEVQLKDKCELITHLNTKLGNMVSLEVLQEKTERIIELEKALNGFTADLEIRAKEVQENIGTISSLVEQKNELTKKSDQEIELLKAKLKEMEEENAVANDELDSNHRIIKEQTQEIFELRERLTKLRDESDSIVDNLKVELAKRNVSLDEARRESHSNQALINQKLHEIKQLEDKLVRIKIEDEQTIQIECRIKSLEKYTKELEERLENKSESKLEIDRLKGQLNCVMAEMGEKVDSLNATICTLEEEKNELTRKSDEKIKLLEASLTEADDENEILTERNESYFEDLAMANEELESSQKIIKEQSDTLVELRETLQKLTDENDSFVNSLKLELAKQTASLEEAQRDNQSNQVLITLKLNEIKNLEEKLVRVKIEDEQMIKIECRIKSLEKYSKELEDRLESKSGNHSCLDQKTPLSKLEIDRLKGQLNCVLKEKTEIDTFVKRVGKMLQIKEDLDISCLSRLVLIMKCIRDRENDFYNVKKKFVDTEYESGTGAGQSLKILKSLAAKKRKKLE